MYIEMSNDCKTTMEMKANKSDSKVSYSIKKLVKQFFKLQQNKSEKLISAQKFENSEKAANPMQSIESLENLRNSDIESECASLESYENEVNERLSTTVNNCELEDYDFADITTVPVHFVRTEHGTFFWTATSEIPADNDLVQPLFCCTSNQIAISQFKDRWAQA